MRVVVDGCWGFAASDVVGAGTARVLAERAVAMARISAPLATARVELAPEPVHVGTWVSAYEIDPFAVPEGERVEAARRAQRARCWRTSAVAHVDAVAASR